MRDNNRDAQVLVLGKWDGFKMCVKMPALHQADLGHLLYVRIRVLQVKIQYIFQIGVNKLSIDTYQHVEKAIPGFLLWIRRTKEQGQIFKESDWHASSRWKIKHPGVISPSTLY